MNVYRVAVVDDEKNIRDSISNFVNKIGENFVAIGSFADGKDVVEFIKTNSVDIIITDIKMIDMSGLELAKYIYENKLNIEVIIISGYRDFEFAQRAIEYNVRNYLLKPTSPKELRKALSKIIKEKLEKSDSKIIEEQIINKLEVLDVSELEVVEQQLKTFICEIKKCSANEMKYLLFNMFTALIDKITKEGIELPQFIKDKSDCRKIFTLNSSEELGNWAEKYLLRITDAINNNKTKNEKFIIDKAIDYINKNYMHDLSLADIASNVYLNEFYFSKMFKKNMRMNLSDYISMTRIQKAKNLLLKGDYKIYQVGEAVGYKNSNYFIKVFKKYTGYTPKEYCIYTGVENE